MSTERDSRPEHRVVDKLGVALVAISVVLVGFSVVFSALLVTSVEATRTDDGPTSSWDVAPCGRVVALIFGPREALLARTAEEYGPPDLTYVASCDEQFDTLRPAVAISGAGSLASFLAVAGLLVERKRRPRD